MRRTIRELKDTVQLVNNNWLEAAKAYESKISQLENSLAEKEEEATKAREKEAAVLECQKYIEKADIAVKEKLEILGNQAAEDAARIKALQEEVARFLALNEKSESMVKLLRSRTLDKDKLINALTKENNSKEIELNECRVQLGMPSSDNPKDNQVQE
jgi:hypothetical protein